MTCIVLIFSFGVAFNLDCILGSILRALHVETFDLNVHESLIKTRLADIDSDIDAVKRRHAHGNLYQMNNVSNLNIAKPAIESLEFQLVRVCLCVRNKFQNNV